MVGFAPSFFYNQQSAGLGIWVATGTIGRSQFNGQFVAVPANATTLIWVNPTGSIGTGSAIPNGSFGIASVVSGQIVTSGNTTADISTWGGYTLSNGIVSITDIRSFA